MTDLRTLLRDAAPAPSTRVNVDALFIEASRRRRIRRPWLWLASIAVALGVGGGAAGVLAPADHPSEVRTLPGPPEQIDGDPVAVGNPGGTTTTMPDRAADASRSSSNASAPAASTQRTSSVEGCIAGGTTSGVGLGHNGGLYAQEHPSCRYEATEAAGYEGHGSWEVEIRRGTETIRYRSGESGDCMPVGTVKPGDVVTVWTDAGTEASADPPYIRVGPNFGCS